MNTDPKPKGRPALYSEKLKPVSVTLDPATRAKAEQLGGGNLSQGLRMAVNAYRVSQPS